MPITVNGLICSTSRKWVRRCLRHLRLVSQGAWLELAVSMTLAHRELGGCHIVHLIRDCILQQAKARSLYAARIAMRDLLYS